MQETVQGTELGAAGQSGRVHEEGRRFAQFIRARWSRATGVHVCSVSRQDRVQCGGGLGMVRSGEYNGAVWAVVPGLMPPQ